MEIDINQLANYYAQAPICFVDAFTAAIPPGSKSDGFKTHEEGCGLVFPLAGRACFTLNGTPYVMEPGMVVHAGPDMKVDKEVIGDKTWQYVLVHYRIPEHGGFPYYNAHFQIQTGLNPRITGLVQQLLSSYAMPGSMATLRCRSLFMSLLEQIILSAKRQLNDSNDELIAQAVAFMHENYAEQFSIEQIAALYGLSGKRFAYLFQKHTGMTPINYLTDLRIRRSKKLLRTCACSIAHVAECVGYKDCYYFSRLFKKQTGICPSEFREQIGKSL